MLQCCGDGVGSNVRYDILDFDFFDDDSLVVVFRVNGAAGACRHDTLLSDKLNRDLGTTQGPTTVSTVGFSELRYQELHPDSPLNELSREQLIEHAVEEGKVGQV
jgi:hypothetical protein